MAVFGMRSQKCPKSALIVHSMEMLPFCSLIKIWALQDSPIFLEFAAQWPRFIDCASFHNSHRTVETNLAIGDD